MIHAAIVGAESSCLTSVGIYRGVRSSGAILFGRCDIELMNVPLEDPGIISGRNQRS